MSFVRQHLLAPAGASARRLLLGAIDHGTRVARKLLPRDSALRKALRRLHKQLPQRPQRVVPIIMARLAQRRPQAFFLQIGANDGLQQDHLRDAIEHQQWSGILIEPVPYVFRKLHAHYGNNPRLKLENVAIADHDGMQTFHYLREASPEENMPDWYNAIGSFRREVVLKHVWGIPDIESRLLSQEVPCMTLATLCARHAISRADLIQIDTEGYDYEIIKLIDFDRLRPTVLLFEHHHLSVDDRRACLAHLDRLGYETHHEVLDTLCLRRDDALGRELIQLLQQQKQLIRHILRPAH